MTRFAESARYEVAVANRQRAVSIDRREVVVLVRRVLSLEQVSSADISMAFVDDREIHAVNRDFLNHDFPTDVISFLLAGDREPGEIPAIPELPAGRARSPSNQRTRAGSNETIRRGAGKTIDGEVVISTETAVRNSATHGTSVDHELALYVVHGLLHLCGYDDLTPVEKRLMRRREAESLALGKARLQSPKSQSPARRTRAKPRRRKHS